MLYSLVKLEEDNLSSLYSSFRLDDENENKDPDDSSGEVTTESPLLRGRNSGKCWSPCSLTLFGLLFCYLIFAR